MMVSLGGGNSISKGWAPVDGSWFHAHLACLAPAAEISALRAIQGKHLLCRQRQSRPSWAPSPIGASRPMAANRWSESGSLPDGVAAPASGEERFYGPPPPHAVGPPVVPTSARMERSTGIRWCLHGPCRDINLRPDNAERFLRAARQFDIQGRCASFPWPSAELEDDDDLTHGARYILDQAGFPRLDVPPLPGTWLELTESWFLIRHDLLGMGQIVHLLPPALAAQGPLRD